jgi:N-acetyl-1-D-myo-inositol-2-amino-2-deoxy-alpha-D-glucopyranoside deacetylase
MIEPVALLAVRPHPDDESSATGGLLAKCAAAGLRTAVLTCTGGEEGEIHDPDLVYEEAFPRLREIRERELRAACAILRISELRLLGYRDSGMAGTEANQHPEAFCNVDLDQAALPVAAAIRELRPTTVVTENEHGGYGHPDHVMCHRVTVRAWQLAAELEAPLAGEPWQPARLYAVASRFEGWEEIAAQMRQEGHDTSRLEAMLERRRQRVSSLPTVPIHAAIDVSDYHETQRAALLCHRTQIPPDNLWTSLPAPYGRRAFATAYLQRLHPMPTDGELDRDLLP